MKKNGFTLIELIVSVVILAAIASSMTFLFKTSLNTFKIDKAYQTSLFSVQSKMEELRAKPFDQIKSEYFENGSGKTIATPISSDLVEIKLSLTWQEGKKPIELYTLRSKY